MQRSHPRLHNFMHNFPISAPSVTNSPYLFALLLPLLLRTQRCEPFIPWCIGSTYRFSRHIGPSQKSSKTIFGHVDSGGTGQNTLVVLPPHNGCFARHIEVSSSAHCFREHWLHRSWKARWHSTAQACYWWDNTRNSQHWSQTNHTRYLGTNSRIELKVRTKNRMHHPTFIGTS